MPSLSSFPFLSPAEFRTACVSLESRVDAFHSTVSSRRREPRGQKTSDETVVSTNPEGDAVTLLGWRDVSIDERNDQTSLRIVKSSEVEGEIISGCEESGLDQDEIEAENDPEALVRQSPTRRLEVEYDITLSPTYQVPVLYFSLRHAPSGGPVASIPAGPAGLDAVYEYLVPPQSKSNLRQLGVMGGISIGNHPISDIPAYFVHPCNTADALRDVASLQDQPTTETYLLLWLGLVGGSVGLHIPSVLLAETGIP